MFRTLLCSAIAVVSVVALEGRQQASRAPAQARAGKAFEIARALAKSRTPGGVVVPEAEFRPGSTPRSSADAVATDLTRSLDSFNRGEPGLRATTDDGVVHVRAASEPAAVRELLYRRVTLAAAKPTTVSHAVLQTVVRELNPSLTTGAIGTGIMPTPDCGLDRPVKLAGRGENVVNTLDAISRQAPGVVWFMTYDPAMPLETLRVGLLCPDGVYLRTKVFS